MSVETETLETFRLETRDWLTENYPDALKAPLNMGDIPNGGTQCEFFHPDAKLWLDRMAEKGWTCPEWPVDCGGAGLNEEEATILREEMARQKCRIPLAGMGRFMLGPTLLKFGSRELQMEHCPKIARGEVRWCQGYSEPNAGSDLASLQMRAEDMGDHYLVTGNKLWTSDAHLGDWMFCLVRTDFSGKKHGGISVVLFDRTDPAVEINPITLISGYSVFYETSIIDLKVPKSDMVGAVNEGWNIAKFLLTHERVMISSLGESKASARQVSDIAKDYLGEDDGRIADPVLRDQIAQQDMDDAAFACLSKRYREMNEVGASVGAASSMLKHVGTKFAKNKFELLLDIEGNQALGWEGEGFNEEELTLARSWLRSKGYSIEGGTSEIMLNVVATRVLGLPKG
ncbi:MAG: acyl-CoA dehydrogenase family protein [Candidatus Hydrogenedentota bacterium]